MELTLLIATHNQGKITELKKLLQDKPYNVIDLVTYQADSQLDTPAPEVDEWANTYIGNALLKAQAVFAWATNRSPPRTSSVVVLADDSGIEVAALNGAPGVLSARFGDPSFTSQERNDFLLDKLRTATDRRATFRSIICLMYAKGRTFVSEGTLEGTLALTPRGERGWGYEPLFVPTHSDFTIGEMKDRDIVVENHRSKALSGVLEVLPLIARELC
jgi:XTP/dITP diphosphohydrolase